MPPMYWSTGIQYSAFSFSKGAFSYFGEQYLRKYQELSTKVSIVSVSLFAFPWHFGHFTSTNSLHVSSGFPCPVNLHFSGFGSLTGRSSYGTGTVPHLAQYTIGIGVPQYLCLDISQSLSSKLTVLFP